jgi:hypothetical protein
MPGQNIYFYNNHPIRFVSLVGLIVARTEVYQRTILTLDDSSGATIDVTAQQKVDLKSSANNTQAPDQGETDMFTGQPIIEFGTHQTPWSAFSITAPGTIHLTSTDRDEIDISALQPGALVRVKGVLSSFRNTMQVHLERFERVADTNAEMQFLDDRLRFLIEVLSVPWILTDDEVEALQEAAERGDERAIEEKRRAEKRARKRMEREEKDARAIARRYEREEQARERELGALREDGQRIMRKFGFT